MTRKIEFVAKTRTVAAYIDPPVTASLAVPKWYKNSKRFDGERVLFDGVAASTNGTIKGCIPVLDSMTAGYIQKSWADVLVRYENEKLIVRTAGAEPVVIQRDDRDKALLPTPTGYGSTFFAFRRPWLPKTPYGYSVLYCHPSYHTDLPFLVLPGIVDSDQFQGAGEASPGFFLKEGFEGLIPKGTPIYQIIPFKREAWVSSAIGEGYDELLRANQLRIKSRFWDRYKKEFWSRKSFQ
jgi:hypothetical protein